MTESAKFLGGVKVRFDWYQTEQHVVVNILHKNIDASRLQINCDPSSINILLPDVPEPLELRLSHQVKSEAMQHKLTPSKLEIKLPKIDGIHWGKLEGEDVIMGKPIPKASGSNETNAKQPKNWDALVKDVDEETEDPLNKLFKKIYSEGSDEVKKAMQKSFTESGGTVLSTNWSEVKTDKVTCKPPDGTEFKKWD